MSMKRPYKRYRPVETSDGEGGFTVTLGSHELIWGSLTVHEEETRVHVDAREDVKVGDIIAIEEEV